MFATEGIDLAGNPAAKSPGIVKVLRQCVLNDPFDLCFEDFLETLGMRMSNAAVRPGLRQIIGRFIAVLRLALRALGDFNTQNQSLRERFSLLQRQRIRCTLSSLW